jgi:hypothetical protein
MIFDTKIKNQEHDKSLQKETSMNTNK